VEFRLPKIPIWVNRWTVSW